MLLSRTTAAEQRCHDAIDIAQACGDQVSHAHALSTLGCCIADLGDLDAGLVRIREALEIAESIGNADQIGRAYTNLTHVLLLACRLDEAAAIIIDPTSPDQPLVGARLKDAGGNAVEALVRLGRWDEADDIINRMDARGTGICVFGPHSVAAMLDIRRGRFVSAAQHLQWGDELAQGGLRAASTGCQFHLLEAELALEEDRPEDASVAAEHGLAAAAGSDDHTYRPQTFAFGVRALADEYESARARGRRLDADKFQRLAATMVEQCEQHVAAWGPDDGQPSRFRALLATTRGRGVAAARFRRRPLGTRRAPLGPCVGTALRRVLSVARSRGVAGSAGLARARCRRDPHRVGDVGPDRRRTAARKGGATCAAGPHLTRERRGDRRRGRRGEAARHCRPKTSG